jgi:hypothetical protein
MKDFPEIDQLVLHVVVPLLQRQKKFSQDNSQVKTEETELQQSIRSIFGFENVLFPPGVPHTNATRRILINAP